MDFINDKIWKPIHTLNGFECCIEYYNLTQRIGRKQTLTTTVHKLVALAFLDQPLASPGKSRGCSRIKHLDGCKTNNSVDNLKWTKIEESDN